MSSSTGDLPGVPINTQPITTMATSTSIPVTTPSTASQVPTQAAPGKEMAPPPALSHSVLSGNQKAASNTAETPGVVITTSTNATATTTTTTVSTITATPTTVTATTSTVTATTLTALTAASTTTTTTTTGTVASGRVTPPPRPEKVFSELITDANNCIYLLRTLGVKQNKMVDLLLDNNLPEGNEKVYESLDAMLQRIAAIFKILEEISVHLPEEIIQTKGVEEMRTLYIQEHTTAHINVTKLLEEMIDCGSWNERNYQHFHYIGELTRSMENSKPNKFPERLPLPPAIFQKGEENVHTVFENAYKMMKKEIVDRSLGIYPKMLHRTASSSVVEFLFGHGGGKGRNNLEIAYTMKFLLVEHNGVIEYINMKAPFESWAQWNNYSGMTSIDPFAPSSYEVYRRLTAMANTHLLNCFGSRVNRWSAMNLLHFISLFGKFRDVFASKCVVCKRHLKNFLPPLVFNIRTPNKGTHEACFQSSFPIVSEKVFHKK